MEAADGQPVERFQATASIYDPVSGTCGGGCKICNIADGLGLANDPLIGAVSTTQQVTATVQWDDGTFTDATLSTRFSSSASSIISVTSTPGVSGSGTATFSTVGTATITGSFTFSGGTPSEPPPVCATSCPTVILTGPTPGKTTPRIDSITPPNGLIGNTTTVTINGQGFGSTPTVGAGTGITINITSKTDTAIQANFAVAANAAAGNHTTTVTAQGQTSNSVNFFVQVPSKIVRFDSPPGAPGGIGPLQTPTDGSVNSLSGTVLAAHQCGVYRNLVYDVVDQSGTPIEGTYTLTETFSSFSGVGTKPPDKPLSVVPGFLIADTQSLSKDAPLCLGPTDNQTFNQKFFATIAGTRFDLTTIINIQRGNFSGTLKVDTNIITP